MRQFKCPLCNKEVEIPDKKFGQSEPPCPECGASIMWFIKEDGDYMDFRVAGGTGAMKGGIKKWGGSRRWRKKNWVQ